MEMVCECDHGENIYGRVLSIKNYKCICRLIAFLKESINYIHRIAFNDMPNC